MAQGAKGGGRKPKGGVSIRQRPDGRWEARVTLGRDPGTGKQIQKSVYAKTQREAVKAAQKLLVDVDNGTYTAPSKLTVTQWLETWLAEYTSDVAESTRVKYAADIRNNILPAIGAVRLEALTPAAVQKLYNDLRRREKPLSAKSIKNVHGVLHQALKQALKLGYIRSNPTEACTLPRIEKAEMKPLDTPDIKRLLDALDDSEYSTLIKVTLFTGMRESEIMGLQWSCVDFKRGTITVRQQLSRPRTKGGVYQLTETKNRKPRTIQPAPYVMNLLKDHRTKQLERRLQAGSLWDDGGFPDLVFTTDTGSHLSHISVLRHYQRTLEKAGIPETRFHDLRHTYAVTSLMAGDDVKTVQENLGHHTAAFTLDQYGHVTDTMKAASAQRMEAFIGGLNKGI